MSGHLRAVWAGLRNGVSPLDTYCQEGLHLGIMMTATEQEIKSRFRHVLAPVPKGPRGNGFYHVNRPAVKPLCGGEGTTDDLAWGDARSKAAREWITCPDCLRLRDEKLGVKTAATKLRTTPAPASFSDRKSQDRADKTTAAGGTPCMACGRPLNPAKTYDVHIINGGNSVLHPDDEDKYVPDGGDIGHWDVGPECIKALPPEFRGGRNKTASLEVRDFEGRVGDRTHLTRRELGTLPTHTVAHLPGVMGEVPGEHRNKHGADWDAFKSDIGQHGIKQPIFITVDHGQEPRISEGNHRRDAAVELGLPHVPVEISYFGHAEQQGTVADRAPNPKMASDTPKYKEGDRVYRYVWSGDRHDPSGLVSTHAIQPLTIKKVSPKTYRVRTDHGGEFQLPHHHIEGYVDWEDD